VPDRVVRDSSGVAARGRAIQGGEDRMVRMRDDGPTVQQVLMWIPVGLVALLLVFVIWDGVYTVAAHEEAVALRFGRYHRTAGPGLHFKIPLVDRVVKVEINERSMRLPFGTSGPSQEWEMTPTQSGMQEQLLILTGDLYAGVVEWNVIWRVAEPDRFLFSLEASQVEQIMTAVARGVMHRTVGDYSADELLTDRREEIGLAAHTEMQRVLDDYECGVDVVAVQMQRVTPPERVKPSFDEVNASIQQKEQLVNEANRERNMMIPQAEAQRDRLIREAEGYAARRRAEADGEIAALRVRFQAYREAPEVTRRRLYLEAMEEVLAGSGPVTVLDAELRGLLPMLNLDPQRAGPAVAPTPTTTPNTRTLQR
jgi:modulator of FtsH protease HflK